MKMVLVYGKSLLEERLNFVYDFFWNFSFIKVKG